ncbi:glycine-rich domain-containing protein [Streptomyces buecherae]|uniref:hypothetical protein n=1 Tax=Streptomyces buecherae TaxID=2763006 RepID=UPI000FD7D96D
MATAVEYKTGASLVNEETFARIVLFMVNDPQFQEDPKHAPGILDQALAYYGAVAVHAGDPLMPSEAVDRGVHAILLHTRESHDLFNRIAGRFLHHNPHPERGGRPAASLAETKAAIRDAGYVVQDKFWATVEGGVSQCDSDDGRPYATA